MRRFGFATSVVAMLVMTAGNVWPADKDAGWNAPAFERAQGRRAWRFPQDHGQHPSFRLEWWYYTVMLRTKAGREFGFQITFFRQGVIPTAPPAGSAWRVQSLYLAHAALSDVQAGALRQSARVGRDSLGISGAAADHLKVWIGNWRADPVAGAANGAKLSVEAEAFSVSLILQAQKPPVLHGDNGLDRKGATVGQASWYYSLPRLHAAGTVSAGGEVFEVTGTAWMDHEFGTNQLGDNQVGWDWFSIRLSDGYDLMLYRLRLKDGGADPASHGTLIDPQGQGSPVRLDPSGTLRPTRHWSSLASGGRYPVAWQIDLPEQQLTLDVQPRFDRQELEAGRGLPFAYWEGAVTVRGTHRGQAVTGEGYLELTGYTGALRQSFR